MKEIYDIVCTFQEVTPPKTEGGHNPDNTAEEIKTPKQAAKDPNNSGFKPRQYDHFVRMRRNSDMWGRMMLLKPDLKYKQRKFLISHKYFVHDTLKTLFAVSMLDDTDFTDCK